MKLYVIGIYVSLVKIKQIVVDNVDLANTIIAEIEDDIYSATMTEVFA